MGASKLATLWAKRTGQQYGSTGSDDSRRRTAKKRGLSEHEIQHSTLAVPLPEMERHHARRHRHSGCTLHASQDTLPHGRAFQQLASPSLVHADKKWRFEAAESNNTSTGNPWGKPKGVLPSTVVVTAGVLPLPASARPPGGAPASATTSK